MTESDLDNIPTIPPIDRINNLKQKESQLFRSGVTRAKAFRVVKDALDAVKEIDVKIKDEDGFDILIKKIIPDMDLRKWGAEMVGKYFGDLVTKTDGENTGRNGLTIIFPSTEDVRQYREREKSKGIPGRLHTIAQDVSRNVEFVGDGENNVVDISGDDIQRVDTK